MSHSHSITWRSCSNRTLYCFFGQGKGGGQGRGKQKSCYYLPLVSAAELGRKGGEKGLGDINTKR